MNAKTEKLCITLNPKDTFAWIENELHRSYNIYQNLFNPATKYY